MTVFVKFYFFNNFENHHHMLRQSKHRRSQSSVLDPCTNMYFSSRWGNLVIKLAFFLLTNEHFPLADLVHTRSSRNLPVK